MHFQYLYNCIYANYKSADKAYVFTMYKGIFRKQSLSAFH